MCIQGKGLSAKKPKITPTVVRPRSYCLSCGLCCKNTEMLLTEDNVKRIESLGYRREEFAERKNGLYFLRNINGHCYFYDPEGRGCKIYKYRPLGCSVYPVVMDVDKMREVVDDYCPLSWSISRREVMEAGIILRHIVSKIRFTP